MGVGMPHSLYLQQFGEYVRRAFGHVPYHVGSSMGEKREWRDVDVRLILPDDEYARMGLGDPQYPQRNACWCGHVLAWSAFGKALTGLPIDFQIQQQTWANEHEDHPRSACFLLTTLKLPG